MIDTGVVVIAVVVVVIVVLRAYGPGDRRAVRAEQERCPICAGRFYGSVMIADSGEDMCSEHYVLRLRLDFKERRALDELPGGTAGHELSWDTHALGIAFKCSCGYGLVSADHSIYGTAREHIDAVAAEQGRACTGPPAVRYRVPAAERTEPGGPKTEQVLRDYYVYELWAWMRAEEDEK